MQVVSAICLFLLASTAIAQTPDSDRAELLNLHQTILQAHLNRDLESWLEIESDTTISANGGSITHQSRSERKAGRGPYLDRTTFESYRDLRDPIVRVSDDGSMGWVIAEVEVIGWAARLDGSIEEISTVWAWIELYQKVEEEWKLTGNVSNSRPLE